MSPPVLCTAWPHACVRRPRPHFLMTALRRSIWPVRRPVGVVSGQPSRRTEDRRPVIEGPRRVEANRVPSARGELGAQDRSNVQALTQQPDHIKMVVALEVTPHQREPRDLPGPKSWNARPSTDEPKPGSSSVWSSAALVALTTEGGRFRRLLDQAAGHRPHSGRTRALAGHWHHAACARAGPSRVRRGRWRVVGTSEPRRFVGPGCGQCSEWARSTHACRRTDLQSLSRSCSASIRDSFV